VLWSSSSVSGLAMTAQTMPAPTCKLCGRSLIGPLLDMGVLPACNQFLSKHSAPPTHRLTITECSDCGLVQLGVYPPPDFVVPRVPWIHYREPDKHLDGVANRLLSSLPNEHGRVIGLGPFDPPLLDRLSGRKPMSQVVVDLLDLGLSANCTECYPYLETLQSCLHPAGLAAVAAKYGTANLVVCRYLLEHSHDPRAMLNGIKHLVDSGGRVVIEVPDSDKFLSRCDYSFVWEEHVSYFSEGTLARLAQSAGYDVVDMLRYEGPLEDALIAVLETSSIGLVRDRENIGTVRSPSGLFGRYRANFAGVRDSWHTQLARAAAGGRKVALFGIGHQAVMFLNALGLQKYVSLLVDDESNKQGYFAPGALSPVVSSAALIGDLEVGTCLLAVSPTVENAVKRKLAGLLDRGVQMYSIFADAPGSSTAEHCP
jgi:hypothetical protein